MKIAKVNTAHYKISLREGISDSTHGELPHFEVVFAKVESDEGVEGIGYTYTIGKGGSAISSLIEREIAPDLIGIDPRRIEYIWQEMWWGLHYVSRGGITAFAMAAVDVALWDLKGKLYQEPLWRLLGGYNPQVVAYPGGVDLLLTLDQLIEQTKKFLGQGYRAIKMKIGRERLSEDVERVKTVRNLIGPDVRLMVDANMRFTVEEAVRASRALADFDIYWMEEPTIPDDIEGHSRIAVEGALPIATGENVHTIYEFRKLIDFARIAFPEPDVSNIGGITPWLKVARLAEANNLPVTTHGVHELHVHLLAAVANPSYLEVHEFGLENFAKETPVLRDGVATAPDRPGHGVEFDWDRLEEFRVKE